MRIHGKIWLLTVSAALLIAVVGVIFYRECRYFSGIGTLSQRAAERAYETRRMIAPEEAKQYISFSGSDIPYDKAENRFYVTQQSGRRWNGRLEASKGRLFFLSDSFLYDKPKAMEAAHDFFLIWMDDTSYSCFYLTLSGLPVLTLDEEHPAAEHTREDSKGCLCVYSMAENGRELIKTESLCDFHKRGGFNISAPKENLKLSLKDADGGQYKCRILDMRSDDDWVLNSLYDDSMGVHNKLAFDIWNEMCRSNASGGAPGMNMEYVEMLINGSYQGLYLLMEYPDAREFNLEEGDVLYRTRRHLDELSEDIAEKMQEAQQEGRTLLDGLELQYPKEDVSKAMSWQPMVEYYGQIAADEQKEISGKTDDSRVWINIDNCIDYGIFIEAVAGEDNVFKNCCICAVHKGDGYEIVKNPWDLNLTWGNCWNDDPLEADRNLKFSPDEVYETEYYFCADLKALLNENPAAVSEKLYTRWQKLREECLSEEWILDALNRNLSLLRRSGAAARDNAKWNTYGFGGDCEEMQAFIRKRMEILDDFYYNLYQENSQEKS